MRTNFLQRFFKQESTSGIVLLCTTFIAIIWANSPLADLQQQFIERFLFIINDGFMAIFFLLVGLELKREFLYGQLAHPSQAILPFVGACGGMLIPAIIYFGLNFESSVSAQGWSIPVATDIAFALGVLSLFGKRIPTGLKLFLLMLAIFDDIGAIIIIGIFYSHGISFFYLGVAVLILGLLYVLNRFGIQSLKIYLALGICLWITVLYSGIHPTLSGVMLALTIPSRLSKESPLHRLEENLHPYVAYLIMPLFALVNAGFSFAGIDSTMLLDRVVLGIILGLFLGKQIGVFFFSWAFVRLARMQLPEKTTWVGLYGVSILCGIGFTMSLFLGTLSFQNEAISYLIKVRLGVIIGSMLSGIVGALVLLIAEKHLDWKFFKNG